MSLSGNSSPATEEPSPRRPKKGTATLISDAIRIFLDHVKVHSPDKPKTHKRYRKVLNHFSRLLSRRKFVEAVTRADIDDCKAARSRETSEQHARRVLTPRTNCVNQVKEGTVAKAGENTLRAVADLVVLSSAATSDYVFRLAGSSGNEFKWSENHAG